LKVIQAIIIITRGIPGTITIPQYRVNHTKQQTHMPNIGVIKQCNTHTTLVRYHTRLTVCTCCACFAKSMMTIYQQFSRIRHFIPYVVCILMLCWREAAFPYQIAHGLPGPLLSLTPTSLSVDA